MKALGFAATSTTLLLLAGCASSPEAFGSAKSFAVAKSHFANYGTNRIHYLTAGKGKQTIVFVHGWSCNSGFWREQLPGFADKARLILVDLPGHGRSDKPQTRYTPDFFAGAVLAVMRDVHVDQAVLVGHSLGTAVICRVYAQSPTMVAALVVVDGFLRRRKMPPEEAEKYVSRYRAADYRDQMARFVHGVFAGKGTEALQDRVLSEMLQTPQHVIVSAMEEPLVAADQPDWDLQKVDVPLLVIRARSPMWGDEDEKYVATLSSRTDYHVMDGVGHFLMLEKPAEFNAALTDMLGKVNLIAKGPRPKTAHRGSSVKAANSFQ